MPRGINAKEFNLRARVVEDDPDMTGRAWARVLARDVHTPANLIGYATFMGPSAATSIQSALGWNDTYCKFQPVKIYVREDWDGLKGRADFKLTPHDQQPPNATFLARREEYAAKELYDLIGIAKQVGLVKPNERGEVLGVSKSQLIDMIVKHELEAEQ